MIQCKQCGTRYNINLTQLPLKENRVRCARCKHIFSIRPPRPKILVAKQNKDFHLFLLELFEGQPFDLIFSEKGEEALSIIEQEAPCLVILDVALPDIHGFELADQLRNDPRYQDIRIILLAAIHDKTRYKRLPESLYGADDYIEAHHVTDKLLSKIRKLLPDLFHMPQPPQGSTGQRPTADDKDGKEIHRDETQEKAARLARLIISDIALYNQEKIEEGIFRGDLKERLASELIEAEEMMKQRFPELSPVVLQDLLRLETVTLLKKNRVAKGVS